MYGKIKKLLKTMKCKKPKVTLNLNGQDLFKMTDLIIVPMNLIQEESNNTDNRNKRSNKWKDAYLKNNFDRFFNFIPLQLVKYYMAKKV